MHASELWSSPKLAARLARTVLIPLSWLYCTGWRTYLLTYKLGLKKAKHPHHPIIVVGNLTTGGFGKSPTVIHLAQNLQDLGHEVVIGCSGYGSPKSEAATLAPDGPLDAAEWGDEPAMFRDRLPDIPLVVGRRRVLAAELVHQHHPNAVLLMDDGFQHLPLKKDVSILLEQPKPTNQFCLPAGPYREPRANKSNADAILWLGPHEGFKLTRGTIQGLPKGERVTAICAIGQPQQFLDAIAEICQLESPLVLPDHDPLTSGNLFDQVPAGLPIVVTAKDWVKLRIRRDLANREIIVARQDVRIEPEQEFRDWLKAKLDESKT